MPNRIIKESIRTSDTLTLVSADAERLFWRLVVSVDDYGRFDGRTNIVIGQCLSAFLGQVTTEQVDGWLTELERAGLLQLYEVDGRRYLALTNWDKHQRRRAKDSKFPAPVDDCGHSRTFDIKCSQPQTNVVPNVNENENVNEIVNENEYENDNVQREVAATVEQQPPDEASMITFDTEDTFLSSSLEPKFRSAYQIYQDSGFGPINKQVQDAIDGLCEEFSERWFTEAVQEAFWQNKPRLAYVRSILQNWRAEGGIRRSGGVDIDITARSRSSQQQRAPNKARRTITGGKVGRI
ncbi:hypothetical protein GCM10025857_15240 [Alicyclobacillus contaminans]|uniref:DnaD domain protein n=1 Tax=Alicyclobacillus contaminans TaxID=392016 RepID=UPI00068672CF|nr:DnaD domain protein [Alicyclobacillus contaminans]GMA50167.1 hypothetical protein GCM10025857_15240 [Alicyclobacillus contaminans]